MKLSHPTPFSPEKTTFKKPSLTMIKQLLKKTIIVETIYNLHHLSLSLAIVDNFNWQFYIVRQS